MPTNGLNQMFDRCDLNLALHSASSPFFIYRRRDLGLMKRSWYSNYIVPIIKLYLKTELFQSRIKLIERIIQSICSLYSRESLAKSTYVLRGRELISFFSRICFGLFYSRFEPFHIELLTPIISLV